MNLLFQVKKFKWCIESTNDNLAHSTTTIRTIACTNKFEFIAHGVLESYARSVGPDDRAVQQQPIEAKTRSDCYECLGK